MRCGLLFLCAVALVSPADLPAWAADSIESSTRARFQECAACPAMTVIPPGHFTMTRKRPRDGRKDDDPEGVPKGLPAREVNIERAFAMGIYPVTRREFSVFVRETHRVVEAGCYVQNGGVWVLDEHEGWSDPGYTQTPRDPVTCVSWNDARDYSQWLNQKERGVAHRVGSSVVYRLPTWEEIEYAAGAGSASLYYWGDQPQRSRANYGAERCLPCRPQKQGADRWLYTSPVGSFPPNAFGLHDMAGNVWQWAQRCGPEGPQCSSQALHGGSWLTNPEYLSTGEYGLADPRHRNYQIGFRVAATLE